MSSKTKHYIARLPAHNSLCYDIFNKQVQIENLRHYLVSFIMIFFSLILKVEYISTLVFGEKWKCVWISSVDCWKRKEMFEPICFHFQRASSQFLLFETPKMHFYPIHQKYNLFLFSKFFWSWEMKQHIPKYLPT